MAKKKGANNYLGSASFLFGAGIAIITGLIFPGTTSALLTSLLILLGIIVGFLNITTKETNAFLVAAVSLVLVSALGGAVLGPITFVGEYLKSILESILTFVMPATIIVALKAIYSLAEK